MYKYLISLAIIVIAVLGGVAYITQTPEPKGGDNVLFVGGQTYTLNQAISSSASTVTLSSFTIPQTGQELIMTDFGNTGYGTIEPGNSSRQEFVSFTGITQNSDGTASLTGVTRGLSPISPYTASTTLQFSHSGGTRFIISDPPQLFDQAAFKSNDETITGQWTFNTNLPSSSLTPITTNQFVRKGYVDGVANQGAATSTETNGGIVELSTATEQASSTGATLDALVLQPQYATSTPSVGCNGDSVAGRLCNVVAEWDGKLNQLWIDLTESFTWTGNHTFSSTSTFNATSTHSGIDVTNVASSTNASTLQVNNLDVLSTFTGGGVAKSASSTTFDASNTYTKSTDVKKVFVQAWGAGASGGNNTTNSNQAGGGGGGEYIKKIFDAADISGTQTITIGSGGAAVSSSANGNDGGDTTFGSLLTAYGGDGGTAGSGDQAGGDCSAASQRFSAGQFWGEGASAAAGGSGYYCGAGGGAVRSGGGDGGGGSSVFGGAGGGGISGTVGNASGGTSSHGGDGGASTSDGTATSGTAPSGGGGGQVGSGQSGAGADGRIIITEFF